MKIDRPTGKAGNRCAAQAGFTIIEVVFASAIAALVLAGMFTGYNMAGRQAQFAACNLAATSTAMRKMEQVISANWIPSYGIDELSTPTLTNTQTGNLCLPSAQGNVVTCTIYTTINTNISSNPPYALIQVQCVWTFPSYGGVFTNTIAVLRAPNI